MWTTVRLAILLSVWFGAMVPHASAQSTIRQLKLTGRAAGNFTMKAWLDEKAKLEQPVSLEPGQTLRVRFPGGDLAASRWRRMLPD